MVSLLTELRYFVSVAETASFTEAASRYDVSQSAISQSIKALEKKIGVTLFTRKNKEVALTKQGQILYKRAVQIIADLDDAIAQAKGTKKALKEKPFIQVELNEYGRDSLGEILKSFAEQAPGVDVKLSKKADTKKSPSYFYLSEEDDGKGVELLAKSQGVFAELPRNSLLSAKGQLTLRDLERLSLIWIGDASEKRKVDILKERLGLKGTTVFVDDEETALSFVNRNRGFLLNQTGLTKRNLKVVPIAIGSQSTHSLYLRYQGEKMNENEEKFLAIAKENQK
jgi:DNA-binding transcriptional LysR family regulator